MNEFQKLHAEFLEKCAAQNKGTHFYNVSKFKTTVNIKSRGMS